MPGCGAYTAGAVASVVYGVRAPAVDGNATRVLARLFGIAESVAAQEGRARIVAAAQALVSAGDPGRVNQALMELGARLCIARRPSCSACPVAAVCRAHSAGTEGRLPVTKRRVSPRDESAWALVVARGASEWLVARRGQGLLGGRDDNPEDLAALDAAWEDEEVTFGPAAAGQCGKDGLIAKVRAVQRPAPGMPASKPQRPIVTYSQRSRA